MGFSPLVGDDKNIAEGSSGEGVDSTYSNLIKFAVFFSGIGIAPFLVVSV